MCRSVGLRTHLILGSHSWTLVAHATSEIVDTCPSHPMLMLSLLGVALNRGLYAEAKTFLRLFLATLIRSHSRHGINPPPIAHPMHPSYLVDLCNEWTSLAPGSCAGSFTHRSFAAVTLEVLMEHGSAAAWTCKSITRLVQLLRTRDFECFLTFLHGLIEMLAARPRHLEDRSLLSRLAKWTGVITSDFFSSSKVGDGERSGTADEHQLHSIVEILVSAYDSGLHVIGINDDGADGMRDPQAALVCAATHCLFTTTTTTTTPLISTISSPRRHAILTLLQEVSPSSTTYDALADLPLPRLRSIAGALRAHNLSSLERALWSCAVKRSRPTSPVVEALLAALVDAVEWGQEREQEEIVVDRMLRGASATSESTSTGSPPRKRARCERTVSRRVSNPRPRIHSSSPSPPSSSLSSSSTESPPRKRVHCERTASRRVSHSHPRIHSPSPCPSSSSSLSTTISVASTPSLSSSSSARSLSESPVPVETAETSEDEEMTRSRPRGAIRFGLCVDLRSVLADALRERKDLREERRRASLRSGRCYGRSVTSSEGEYSCGGEEGTAVPALVSEGDVLDLFAYEDPI